MAAAPTVPQRARPGARGTAQIRAQREIQQYSEQLREHLGAKNDAAGDAPKKLSVHGLTQAIATHIEASVRVHVNAVGAQIEASARVSTGEPRGAGMAVCAEMSQSREM